MPPGRGGTRAAKMVRKRPARCESPALRERRSSSAVKRRPAASSRAQKRKTGAKTPNEDEQGYTPTGISIVSGSVRLSSAVKAKYKTGYERTPPKMRALLCACRNRDVLAAEKALAALGDPNLRGVLGFWPESQYHQKLRPDLSYVDLVVAHGCDYGAERPKGNHSRLIKLLQGAGSRLTKEGLLHCLDFYKLLDSWVRQGLKLDGFDLVDPKCTPDECGYMSYFEFFLMEVGNFQGVRMIQEHCKRWIRAGVQIWPFCGPHKVSPSVPPCTSGATEAQLRVVRLLWQDWNGQESDDEVIPHHPVYNTEGLRWSKQARHKLISSLSAAGEDQRRNAAWWRRGTLLMYCRRGSLRAKGLAAFLQRIHQAAPELLMSVLKFV